MFLLLATAWVGAVGTIWADGIMAPPPEVRENLVEYKDGEAVLEGVLVYNPANTSNVPGVVVVPDWMGVGPFAIARAAKLASIKRF